MKYDEFLPHSDSDEPSIFSSVASSLVAWPTKLAYANSKMALSGVCNTYTLTNGSVLVFFSSWLIYT